MGQEELGRDRNILEHIYIEGIKSDKKQQRRSPFPPQDA